MLAPMKSRGAVLFLLAWLAGACGDDAASGGAGGSSAEGAGGAGAGSGGEPATGGAGEGAAAGGQAGGGGAGGSFEGVDPLLGVAEPALVQGGFEFTEGPVY